MTAFALVGFEFTHSARSPQEIRYSLSNSGSTGGIIGIKVVADNGEATRTGYVDDSKVVFSTQTWIQAGNFRSPTISSVSNIPTLKVSIVGWHVDASSYKDDWSLESNIGNKMIYYDTFTEMNVPDVYLGEVEGTLRFPDDSMDLATPIPDDFTIPQEPSQPTNQIQQHTIIFEYRDFLGTGDVLMSRLSEATEMINNLLPNNFEVLSINVMKDYNRVEVSIIEHGYNLIQIPVILAIGAVLAMVGMIFIISYQYFENNVIQAQNQANEEVFTAQEQAIQDYLAGKITAEQLISQFQTSLMNRPSSPTKDDEGFFGFGDELKGALGVIMLLAVLNAFKK